MSVKILLIGARLCRNLGGPSLLATTTRVIDEFLQDAEYTFISPTSEDLPLAEEYGVSIIAVPSWKKIVSAALAKAFLGISFGSRNIREVVEAFAGADIVIDILGIGFADTLGRNTFRGRAFHGIHLLVGKIFHKPVVKYTADLGPFETRWNRFFARLYLQHAVDLILARSDITRQRLDELGVTTAVRVCPDTAFLLESQTTPFAEQLSSQKIEGPIVGFSVSHMAARQSGNPEAYLASMANLTDHIVESVGAKIVLIPNELSTDVKEDDMHYITETWNRMASKTRAMIVSGEYTAPQLKGIIRQCDVMVAARYHSIIASLSQEIPVLVIGWHDKYRGVLGLVGQERYLCSVKSLDLDDLKEKFDDLWNSRDRIKQEISAALPKIREAILRGGEEVSLLLNKKVTEAV